MSVCISARQKLSKLMYCISWHMDSKLPSVKRQRRVIQKWRIGPGFLFVLKNIIFMYVPEKRSSTGGKLSIVQADEIFSFLSKSCFDPFVLLNYPNNFIKNQLTWIFTAVCKDLKCAELYDFWLANQVWDLAFFKWYRTFKNKRNWKNIWFIGMSWAFSCPSY